MSVSTRGCLLAMAYPAASGAVCSESAECNSALCTTALWCAVWYGVQYGIDYTVRVGPLYPYCRPTVLHCTAFAPDGITTHDALSAPPTPFNGIPLK